MVSDSFSADQEVILEMLGDKMIEAWGSAVALTRFYLERYRLEMPELAMSHSTRGLANMIHDWLWDHLLHQIYGMDGVMIVESEAGPLRELVIGDQIRVRVKRQSATGSVATSQTSLALGFYQQQPEQLSLLPPEIKLVFGYSWDSAKFEIGSATVSCPRSIKKSLWVHEIPESVAHSDMPLRTEPPSLKVISEEEDPESMTDNA